MSFKPLLLTVLACVLLLPLATVTLRAGAEEKPEAKPEQKPEATAETTPKAKPEEEPYRIEVDTSEVPEMNDYGVKVKAVAEEWYPKIVALLPVEGREPFRDVTITFKKDYRGIAAAGGNRIVCGPKWFKDHPEDLGAIVHELAHVVQDYRHRRNRPPGWLVEGIADHVRFFHYEPAEARPRPHPERSKYSDSYRTAAAFLNWAQETYDKELVVKLNAACRRGEYDAGLWKEYTGKTLEELGAEWKESLRKQG